MIWGCNVKYIFVFLYHKSSEEWKIQLKYNTMILRMEI